MNGCSSRCYCFVVCDRDERSLSEANFDKHFIKKLIKKNNRGTKRIAGLLLGYVALPLVVCALIVLIKSFLLSVISLEISKTWIFQTLVDHWLECFLIGVLNFNLLTKLIRGRG